ncbi:MAG: methylated-DNA--[protein]-cysteine S-methyltransferase [Xanthobacteraceae bacterium]|nr:methylated-DNA--[protein]-cysteine S-methyltransferase [Xanthobacteraceae bacterium]
MHAQRTTPRPRAATGARAFRKPDEELAFATGDTELGAVLIARSTAGVCSILMGSNEDELCDDLEGRFPNHKLVRDDAGLAKDVRKVQRFIEKPAAGLDLALDVRGTPWQRRVWSALLGVPAGSTVTYAALAARLGEPGSARAVARACAENAIALAIPCHRVIRKDGTLSGYRWGVERKRALLAREAA